LANLTSTPTAIGGGGSVGRGSIANFTAVSGGGASYVIDVDGITLLWIAAGSGGASNASTTAGGCAAGSETFAGEGGTTATPGITTSSGPGNNGGARSGGNCTETTTAVFGYGGGSGLFGGGACCGPTCTGGGGGSSTNTGTGVVCTAGTDNSVTGIPALGWDNLAGKGVVNAAGSSGEVFVYW